MQRPDIEQMQRYIEGIKPELRHMQAQDRNKLNVGDYSAWGVVSVHIDHVEKLLAYIEQLEARNRALEAELETARRTVKWLTDKLAAMERFR